MLCGEYDIQTLHDGVYQPREADGGALGEQSLPPIGRAFVTLFVYLNNLLIYTFLCRRKRTVIDDEGP